MNKKAQSAMEYLMTYGWAILVVLIALGALFYLGVFSPTTPTICQIAAPFTCMDIVTNANDTGSIVIGATGISDGAIITASGDCTIDIVAPNTNVIDSGENTKTFACAGIVEGDKISGDISIAYTLSGSDIAHTATGSYSGTVEA